MEWVGSLVAGAVLLAGCGGGSSDQTAACTHRADILPAASRVAMGLTVDTTTSGQDQIAQVQGALVMQRTKALQLADSLERFAADAPSGIPTTALHEAGQQMRHLAALDQSLVAAAASDPLSPMVERVNRQSATSIAVVQHAINQLTTACPAS